MACKNIGKKLEYAAARASESGQRWTDMRVAVFMAVLNADKPMSAYQIIEAVSVATQRDVKPASVYRSLDALCGLGLLVRIESLGAFTACDHPEADHQHVFLVCNDCGTADELHDHHIAKQLCSEAISHGFHIQKQVLELQGQCRACQA